MEWFNIGLQQNMKVITMDKELREILQTCISVIDIGADRGAWKGPELPGIGTLRLGLVARIEQDDNAVKGELDNGDGEE